jgi:hypothetical protein
VQLKDLYLLRFGGAKPSRTYVGVPGV